MAFTFVAGGRVVPSRLVHKMIEDPERWLSVA